MSLSANQKKQPDHFPKISLSGIVPQVLDPAPDKPDASDSSPKTNDADQPTEQQPKETDSPEAKAPRQKGAGLKMWQSVALDSFLVALVVGVLAGGGYYMKEQWDKYRVPTIMELTQAQCMELCAQREALQDAANLADEQIHMRRMLAHLENKLSDFSAKSARLRASIAEQQNRVLALQHEIRRADKESRVVARGLLPGLPVGNVSTKRGRVYANATISRLQGKRISVRTSDGAASFPISELIKNDLPTIVLYALGEIDLIDTSDFTTDGAAPAATTPTNTRLRTINLNDDVADLNKDYAPPGKGPVVDTNASKTDTSAGDDLTEPVPQRGGDDSWQAPTGDLPL